MLIPTMAVNLLGCRAIPHNDDQQDIFANRICKKLLLNVHTHMLSPYNNHVKHVWPRSENVEQIPLPERAEWGLPHLVGLFHHSELVTNMGSPILPGNQSKTAQGITSLPGCHSNESLHVKWLPWQLQWQSHCSAGQKKPISLLYTIEVQVTK
jgi:hypothetical protein